VLIRVFLDEDADALAALFHASVRQIAIRDYSIEQVAAWSPSPPDATNYLSRSRDGRLILVAVNDDGEPVGYGDLEPDGHVDHLYCRPDVVGTGVGSALCAALEAAATERGIARLYLEASEAARRLLERRGFIVERRNDFTRNGVAIHNYRMTRTVVRRAG
jgi:putative acetyltransferase